jgi:hypothetical protein
MEPTQCKRTGPKTGHYKIEDRHLKNLPSNPYAAVNLGLPVTPGG